MLQQQPSHDQRTSLTPREVDALLQRARAERDAALGRAIGAAIRGVAAALTRFHQAIDDAWRLRALATLDDRRLAALGITRTDLPAIVYGWHRDGACAEPLELSRLLEADLPARERRAA